MRSSTGVKNVTADAGPVGEVVARRRPERGEVAARQVLERLVLADRRWAEPVLGERERVRATFVHVPDGGARTSSTSTPLQASPAGAPGGSNSRRRSTISSRLRVVPLTSSRSAAFAAARSTRSECGWRTRSHHCRCALADPDGERPVVARRHEVDRAAHERRLNDRAPLERAVERVALEAVEARPEADVRVRRVLVLDAADPLERAWDREARSLEQQLPREQRAVQLALREDALRHGPRKPSAQRSDQREHDQRAPVDDDRARRPEGAEEQAREQRPDRARRGSRAGCLRSSRVLAARRARLRDRGEGDRVDRWDEQEGHSPRARRSRRASRRRAGGTRCGGDPGEEDTSVADAKSATGAALMSGADDAAGGGDGKATPS